MKFLQKGFILICGLSFISVLLKVALQLNIRCEFQDARKTRDNPLIKPVKTATTINLITATSRTTTSTPTTAPKTQARVDVTTKSCNDEIRTLHSLKELSISIAVQLRKARTHARGIKTSKSLSIAISEVEKALKTFGLSYNEVTARQTIKPKHICPEHYTNSSYGFPLYDVGYVTESCSYATPIEKLVSIVLLFNHKKVNNVDAVLHNILQTFNNPIVIAGVYGNVASLKKKYPRVQIEHISVKTYDGLAWNSLIRKVTTEYTFIGRDITKFDHDARLDRLVREMEILNISVAGGSTRNTEHKWNVGCYQRAHRNYSIIFEEGYDESLHDCLFCDYIIGPFVIKTDLLKRIKFDENIYKMGLFEDLFMNISEALLCPDSMFYTKSQAISDKADDWESFAAKRSLVKIKVPVTSSVVDFGCHRKYPVYGWGRPFSIHPCRMNNLAQLVGDVMDTCKRLKIICEIDSGTLVGALKFSGILPWELDSDAKFYFTNYSALLNLQDKFVKIGYKIIKGYVTKPCIQLDYSYVRYFDILSSQWRLDFNSYCLLSSYDLLSKGQQPTQVRIYNRFMNSPRNPALTVRNRYPEVFGHSEHYAVIPGVGMWGIYPKPYFRKCDFPGNQFCLDQYHSDGNLQFKIILP